MDDEQILTLGLSASAPLTPEMEAQIAVYCERERQRQEFSEAQDDELTAPEWIARIAKHLGRAVTLDRSVFRHSMVVVGAIALAAIEWHDRRYSQ